MSYLVFIHFADYHILERILTNQVYIESRATSSWEHGNPIHPGTQNIFRKHNISYDSTKTSQQISQKDRDI